MIILPFIAIFIRFGCGSSLLSPIQSSKFRSRVCWNDFPRCDHPSPSHHDNQLQRKKICNVSRQKYLLNMFLFRYGIIILSFLMNAIVLFLYVLNYLNINPLIFSRLDNLYLAEQFSRMSRELFRFFIGLFFF